MQLWTSVSFTVHSEAHPTVGRLHPLLHVTIPASWPIFLMSSNDVMNWKKNFVVFFLAVSLQTNNLMLLGPNVSFVFAMWWIGGSVMMFVGWPRFKFHSEIACALLQETFCTVCKSLGLSSNDCSNLCGADLIAQSLPMSFLLCYFFVAAPVEGAWISFVSEERENTHTHIYTNLLVWLFLREVLGQKETPKRSPI